MQIAAGQACGNEDYRHLNHQATAVSVHKRRFLCFMMSLVMVINKYCDFRGGHTRTAGQIKTAAGRRPLFLCGFHRLRFCVCRRGLIIINMMCNYQQHQRNPQNHPAN